MRTSNSYEIAAMTSVSASAMVASEAFRNATVTLVATGSANLTIKAYASNQASKPDLSVAASLINQYSEVQITGLND